MMYKTKLALSLAIILGTASAAMAATKHPTSHHRVVVKRQLSGAGAYAASASGFVRPRAIEPSYMSIQSRDYRENN
jgi:hypothetical protein